MTVSNGTVRSLRSIERRSGADRRQRDVDLQGRPDRRRAVESRKPEVAEVELSESEWNALNGDAAAAVG